MRKIISNPSKVRWWFVIDIMGVSLNKQNKEKCIDGRSFV